MKIYILTFCALLSIKTSFSADNISYKDERLNFYFKKQNMMPIGPFSEEKGYEVYVRLKHDKFLDDHKRFCFSFPSDPLVIEALQDELNCDAQRHFGRPLQYKEKVKYPVIPEEFYHDLFKIGCFFLHYAGDMDDSKALDMRKTSEKWLYRAAINGHVYAWYGLGLLWLMDKAEEGHGSANYYLSVLAISTFKFPKIIIKNKDTYTLKAIQKKYPEALVEQSFVEEDKGEYQKKLSLLTDAHHLGSVRANLNLGLLYYYGCGEKALSIRLLEGERFPETERFTFTRENGRIYSFDHKLQTKEDVTEECHSGIAPDKNLAYQLLKEAADKGYKPAMLEMRNLFQRLEYLDPLSPHEEVKAIEGFTGTFIDFLNVCLPNLNGNYKMIESLIGDSAYGSIYRESTKNWNISACKIDFYLQQERHSIFGHWSPRELEKNRFEEVVLPKISMVASQFPLG